MDGGVCILVADGDISFLIDISVRVVTMCQEARAQIEGAVCLQEPSKQCS